MLTTCTHGYSFTCLHRLVITIILGTIWSTPSAFLDLRSVRSIINETLFRRTHFLTHIVNVVFLFIWKIMLNDNRTCWTKCLLARISTERCSLRSFYLRNLGKLVLLEHFHLRLIFVFVLYLSCDFLLYDSLFFCLLAISSISSWKQKQLTIQTKILIIIWLSFLFQNSKVLLIALIT